MCRAYAVDFIAYTHVAHFALRIRCEHLADESAKLHIIPLKMVVVVADSVLRVIKIILVESAIGGGDNYLVERDLQTLIH